MRAPTMISAIPAVEVIGSGKRKRTSPAMTKSAPSPYLALARANQLLDSYSGSSVARLRRMSYHRIPDTNSGLLSLPGH